MAIVGHVDKMTKRHKEINQNGEIIENNNELVNYNGCVTSSIKNRKKNSCTKSIDSRQNRIENM